MDDQPETIIPCHYRVAGFKKTFQIEVVLMQPAKTKIMMFKK